MVTFKKKYVEEVQPKLMEEHKLTNLHQVPRMDKIVVNMGIGLVDKDSFRKAVAELATITGQAPTIRKARKSISNFKLREGQEIGACVTLRGDRMYEFMDRLINTSLPRIRDFRGLPTKGFDGNGNYTFGVRDQTIFPEIDPDKVKRTQGLDITFVTTGTENEGARSLLTLMGMPFRKAS